MPPITHSDVHAAVCTLMKDRTVWAGTAAQLAEAMRLDMHPRALSAALNKLKPILVSEGYELSHKRTPKERLLYIGQMPGARARMRQRSTYRKDALCDRCGHMFRLGNIALDAIHEHWETEVFMGKTPRDLKAIKGFCYRCAMDVNDHIHQLGELHSIQAEISQLGDLINERRTQNHRPAAHDAGQCSEGRDAGEPGHRPGHSPAQAGEEHHGLDVQRDEDRDVPARGRTDRGEAGGNADWQRGLSEIARALHALGKNHAGTNMGAIELLSLEIKNGAEAIAGAIERLAEAVENHG